MLHSASLALSRFSFNDALVMPGTVDQFMTNLQEFMNTNREEGERLAAEVQQQVEQTYYGTTSGPGGPTKPFIFQDGIAVIPVHGVLINRFNYSWGFVTGYSYIRTMFRAAMSDPDVKLIAFDVNSPGGDAPGCFELCEEIRAGRADKPSIAVVDALSASGGYAIPSSCSRMVCTPSGSVGSVGVYWIHADLSGRNEQQGIKYTIFEAPEGGAKMDGAPYGPMSERAAKEAQERVNVRYQEFVALVAENRGMTTEEVIATQARVVRAEEGLALGLIDAVSTPSEAVADFLGELASDDPGTEDDEEITMGDMPKDQAALDAITSAAAREAVSADRKRRSDIMALPAAAKRQKLATALADDDTTVEQATRILNAAAEETVSAPTDQQQQQQQQQTQQPQGQQEQQQQQPQGQQPTGQQQQQQGRSQFERAMDQGGGAGVGYQGGNQPDQQGAMTDDEKADMILGDHTAVTGRRYDDKK